MTSMSKIRGLPLLLKQAEIELPFQRVNLQVTKIKKRDIQLLEWAIMAPLANLDPRPTLNEIAQEFGIEPVDFLRIVAEQLKIMGLLQEIGFNNYQLTDIGRKFFAEGKVISDPQNVRFHIYYHENTKEWIYGFSKEGELTSSNDSDSSLPDPQINMDTSTIGIPEKIVVDHMQKRKELEKNESISEYNITEIVPCKIRVNAKFLLKSDGIAVITTKQPFGEENKQRMSLALRKEILVPFKLKQYLNDTYAILENVQLIEKVQPHEIADSILFTLESEDELIEYLTAKKPRYLISNRTDISSINSGSETPDLLFTKQSYSSYKNNDSIIGNIIHFQTEGLLPQYAYLTDNLAVKIVNVVCDNDVEIPLFLVKEHQIDDKESRTISDYIKNVSCDGKKEELERDLALFYIKPDAESFDQLLMSIDTLRHSADYTQEKSIEFLQGLLLLRTLISDLEIGQFEQEIINNILKSISWKNLFELDHSIIETYPSGYINAVNNTIVFESFSGNLHQLLENYSNLFNKIEKYTQGYSSEIQQLRDSYIGTIAKSFNRNVRNIYEKDIQDGINLFFDISDEKIKNNFGNSLILALISIKIPSDKKISMLLRLAEGGINPESNYVNQIGKEMLTASLLNICDPGLLPRVQKIIETCKSLNPSCEIGKDLVLPEFTINPQRIEDIATLVRNLFKLRNLINSLSSQKISEVLQKVSIQLCDSGNSEKLRLWVELLVIIRSHEKEEDMQFIQVDESKIISALSSLDAKKLNKMKDKLKLLNVYSVLIGVSNESKKNDKNTSDSSFKGIIIDGSNVAYAGQEGKKPSAQQLIKAYKDLKNQGYNPVFVIVGAGLRHAMNTNEYNNMEKFFHKISKKNQKEIFQQAPAGHDDDDFIIKIALESNMQILTNDLYRDMIQKHPDKKGQIEPKLVKYMFNPENKTLITSEKLSIKLR